MRDMCRYLVLALARENAVGFSIRWRSLHVSVSLQRMEDDRMGQRSVKNTIIFHECQYHQKSAFFLQHVNVMASVTIDVYPILRLI